MQIKDIYHDSAVHTQAQELSLFLTGSVANCKSIICNILC